MAPSVLLYLPAGQDTQALDTAVAPWRTQPGLRLEVISVDPAAQSRGVGRALQHAADERIEGLAHAHVLLGGHLQERRAELRRQRAALLHGHGAVSGQVAQSEAAQRAALYNYQFAIQNAFADVDKAQVEPEFSSNKR